MFLPIIPIINLKPPSLFLFLCRWVHLLPPVPRYFSSLPRGQNPILYIAGPIDSLCINNVNEELNINT